MSLKLKTIKSTKWSALSSLTIIVLGFLQMVILSRILEPFEFGILSIMTVVFLFTDMLADCGLSNAIIQKKNITLDELSALYWVNIFLGFFLFVTTMMLSYQIASWMKLDRLSLLIQLTALVFLIMPHGQQYRALMQKELEFDILSKIESFSYLAGFCLTVIVGTITKNASCAVFGYLLTVSSRTAILSVVGRKFYHPTWKRSKLREIKGQLLFSFYLTLDSILNYINSSITTPIVARFLGAIYVGGYNLSFNVAVNPPSKISPIITRVLFPALSKIQDDNDKLRINFFKLLHVISYINFPALLGLCIVAKDFVYLVFGDKWLFIVPTLQLLCIAGAMRMVANPIGSLLMAKAKMELSVRFNLVKIIIFIPVLYFLTIWYGMVGAATGFLICQIINALLSYFFLLKPLLGKCFIDYVNSFFIPFIHTLPMVLLLLASNHYVAKVTLLLFILKIVICGFIYILTIFISPNKLLTEMKGLFRQLLLKK
ncbi:MULTISPECIES: MOP flippase family protein [Klebsiella]|nr:MULTISPECIES: MOP flippase family protein [Klebsiella]HBQ6249244.1 MOP flippase family protein [Klebsiella variicola subsp. variicola]MCI4417834.1 MOP flippase family protein [Klebsiella variicola]OFV44670.1 lipopolysaccharide biosynthesis protein [Klebsiella sp. HMSC16C06]HBQ6254039.1 MOP flippase family protein [Klebsiella variicola subsp. variicola]HBQ6646392.1 MOP flippase family protein [Klebsiella variicola subsp. variicola]